MLLGSGHIGARTATSLDDWAPLTQERPSPSLDALPALAGQSPANLVSYNPGGQPNGPARGPFTSWFRYPAGFSAQTLETCLDSVRVTRGSRVLDPFAGVATAGCAVVARGGEFIGIEAHPLIAEVAALKFACPREPAGLLAAGIAVLARDGHRSLELETTLVRSCFDEPTLTQLVKLRAAIKASRSPWRLYLKWALLAMLRETANVRTGWPYQRPAMARRAVVKHVDRRFLERLSWMQADLESRDAPANATIILGDSRKPATWVAAKKSPVDACIPSPPYLNNYDYLDATRLEMYFWGDAHTWSDLMTIARRDLVIATTHHTTDRAAFDSWRRLGRVSGVRERLTPLRDRLTEERHVRPRAKEYDRQLACYFADMLAVLKNTSAAMLPGARLAWVVGDSAPYGIYIDTPQFICDLAEEVGLPPVSHPKFLRSRGLRWRTNGTRHTVGLAESLLLLAKPG